MATTWQRATYQTRFAAFRDCRPNLQAAAPCRKSCSQERAGRNRYRTAHAERAVLTDRQISAADGIRLHLVSAGQHGRVMLFLHGFPEFWMAWHRQLAEFGRDHRAIALDLRGYNLSDKPREVEAYALPRLAADIAAVLRALSPNEPAIVVGHDWGGLVAWQLARDAPELIDRMVIINAPHPVLFGRVLRRSWKQRFASSYALFFQMRGFSEFVLRAFDYAALRKMVFGITSRPEMFSAEVRAAYREAWSQPAALSASLNYYRNGRNFRTLADRADSWRIHVPTLVLWGDLDPALLPMNLGGLRELVPRATVEIHPTATHWIVHEEPAWVNNAIRAFVQSR